MSKKNRKKTKIVRKKVSRPGITEKDVRAIVFEILNPIISRIDFLSDHIDNLKSNVVVALELLEKNGTLDEESFRNAFIKHKQSEGCVVNRDGSMEGFAVLSIYNEEKRNGKG